MHDPVMSTTPTTRETTTEGVGGRAILGLATIFALFSATCCVLPIGLSIIGIGGAWLTVFAPFTQYRALILVVVAVIVGFAWLRLFRRYQCGRVTKSALVLTLIATLALIASLSAPYWEGYATRALWAIWMDTR
jgi:mercuric ion transport protein